MLELLLFGQDPLWLAWANDLINFKNMGDMASYNQLLNEVTPARFKVGQILCYWYVAWYRLSYVSSCR